MNPPAATRCSFVNDLSALPIEPDTSAPNLLAAVVRLVERAGQLRRVTDDLDDQLAGHQARSQTRAMSFNASFTWRITSVLVSLQGGFHRAAHHQVGEVGGGRVGCRGRVPRSTGAT